MTLRRPAVNILHRHHEPLFAPHFDPDRDGYDVVENGDGDRDWDLVIVFEALAPSAPRQLRTRRAMFVSGEPPAIGNHARAFLVQFDAVFCADAPRIPGTQSSGEQHFNNWHFGYSAAEGRYRYDHRSLRDLPPPAKTATLATVTSNLNYLPMHIKRRALIDKLAVDYAGRIDIFGRPHRYVEYKEDAILPYRFHLCIENCQSADLWTEKIADALLGYAVPVYAGCPNIEKYFPGATIPIDLDDYASARKTIDAILADGEAIYRQRFDALVEARRRLMGEFDISRLVETQLRLAPDQSQLRALTPEADLPLARARDIVARLRRKATTFVWRRKVALRG